MKDSHPHLPPFVANVFVCSHSSIKQPELIVLGGVTGSILILCSQLAIVDDIIGSQSAGTNNA